MARGTIIPTRFQGRLMTTVRGKRRVILQRVKPQLGSPGTTFFGKLRRL